MTYYYKGAGVSPEVPGVPMFDLTDEQFATFSEIVGEAALRGVYVRDEPALVPIPDDDDEEVD